MEELCPLCGNETITIEKDNDAYYKTCLDCEYKEKLENK